jgi:hypothetical protein
MVRADIALFTALGSYFTGIAEIHRAELSKDESEGLRKAAKRFEQACKHMATARTHEERILATAQEIDFSAYFVRRHEVASTYTQALANGLEAMAKDLADGFYPAEACSALNPLIARLTSNFEQDAKIEGVLNRLERLGSESN